MRLEQLCYFIIKTSENVGFCDKLDRKKTNN